MQTGHIYEDQFQEENQRRSHSTQEKEPIGTTTPSPSTQVPSTTKPPQIQQPAVIHELQVSRYL